MFREKWLVPVALLALFPGATPSSAQPLLQHPCRRWGILVDPTTFGHFETRWRLWPVPRGAVVPAERWCVPVGPLSGERDGISVPGVCPAPGGSVAPSPSIPFGPSALRPGVHMLEPVVAPPSPPPSNQTKQRPPVVSEWVPCSARNKQPGGTPKPAACQSAYGR
jgi:hypothetical protein